MKRHENFAAAPDPVLSALRRPGRSHAAFTLTPPMTHRRALPVRPAARVAAARNLGAGIRLVGFTWFSAP